MVIRLYLDSIFLMQVTFNCMLLMIVRLQLGVPVSHRRIWLIAGMTAGGYTLLILLPVPLGWLEIPGLLLNAGSLLLFFLPPRYRRYRRKMLLYVMADTLVASGILRIVLFRWYLWTQNTAGVWEVLFCALLLYEAVRSAWTHWRRSLRRHIYPVTILSAGQKRQILALYDTGNGLTEPISGRPVCLVEEELLAGLTLENPLFLRAIPFHTVGCDDGLLYGVEVPELLIDAEDGVHSVKDVVCAGVTKPFSSKGRYQMILHPGIF
ncbi:MAG: sigma-E processing peptidase SpoIIGA [Lachnospiraceae bacterium]|nr:sigma-E processing peptidase SpoIIGA [Lachnospiraceae bacterium]